MKVVVIYFKNWWKPWKTCQGSPSQDFNWNM